MRSIADEDEEAAEEPEEAKKRRAEARRAVTEKRTLRNGALHEPMTGFARSYSTATDDSCRGWPACRSCEISLVDQL